MPYISSKPTSSPQTHGVGASTFLAFHCFVRRRAGEAGRRRDRVSPDWIGLLDDLGNTFDSAPNNLIRLNGPEDGHAIRQPLGIVALIAEVDIHCVGRVAQSPIRSKWANWPQRVQ